MSSKEVWLNVFNDLKEHGKKSSPRGLETIEIENYMFSIDPIKDKFCSFKHRKLSLKYLCAELAWYLNGDPNDEMMEQYSSFWKTIKNHEKPYFHSNYGQYIFGEKQFDYCIDTLIEDKDSRQACIIISRPNVMMSTTNDKICTYALSFRIRENVLNMSTNFRSQDFFYGTMIDLFEFSIIYEMMYITLKETYKDLQTGLLTNKCDSLHFYKRHFEMFEKILQDDEFIDIDCPRISSISEVSFMRNKFPWCEECIRKGYMIDHRVISKDYKFTKWFIENLKK